MRAHLKLLYLFFCRHILLNEPSETLYGPMATTYSPA